MFGLEILARSMSVPTKGGTQGKPFQHGNSWQYHPRSDRHSKIACWAIMFDFLRECPLLVDHVRAGKTAIGINHPMRDFARNRSKNLDLVVCRSGGPSPRKEKMFADLVAPFTIVLSDEERSLLGILPPVPLASPSTVYLALEAKACMSAFGKARPRLYDELNSSHLTIHGDTAGAIAAGFAMINIARTFVSPIRNPWPLASHEPIVSVHQQPKAAASVIEKLMELPRRARQSEEGFDAFGIAVVECANDGTPVRIHSGAPAPAPSAIYHYSQMIGRVSHLYATRFSAV